MILQGRVSVDGKVVRKLGTRVDPAKQVVRVDGERVEIDEKAHIVLALNKPVGMVCLAWAQGDGGCEALTCQFSGTRAEVREQAVRLALSGILKRVMAATLMA